VQTVFELLDTLRQWAASPVEAGENAAATAHLDTIAPLKLADAAFRCSAYTRALKYFEAHLCARKRDADIAGRAGAKGTAPSKTAVALATPVALSEKEITFLQKVYSQIEEPDGMLGLAALRKDTTLAQRTKDHEAAGEWERALACYEQALAGVELAAPQGPESVQALAQRKRGLLELQLGVLGCHRNLGHLHTAMAQVHGFMAAAEDDAATLARLAANGVQSAWR
jgi:serine/threonine-protein kinase ATR